MHWLRPSKLEHLEVHACWNFLAWRTGLHACEIMTNTELCLQWTSLSTKAQHMQHYKCVTLSCREAAGLAAGLIKGQK
eukprot:1152091-Pelagomonas_calceolata.AAC.1